MVAPTLVKITLFDTAQSGDTGHPFEGRALFKPSLVRHIEGETPPDYVVTTREFGVTFGEPLMNGAVVVQAGAPGVAWVYLEPTDYGVYADAWTWHIRFLVSNTHKKDVYEGDFLVPTSGAIVDFGDLVQASPGPPPDLWFTQLQSEIASRINEDLNLQEQIDDLLARSALSVSDDGSFGLPLPTGVGFEWLFTNGQLEGPYMNGVAL